MSDSRFKPMIRKGKKKLDPGHTNNTKMSLKNHHSGPNIILLNV